MKYLTKLDLNSGYWQIPISDRIEKKRCFLQDLEWDYSNLMCYRLDSLVAQAIFSNEALERGEEGWLSE